MAIEMHEGGGFSVTGKEDINRFRLITLKHGLRLEKDTGMKLTRGPSAYSIIKREFGFKGNKQKVYDQFVAYCVSVGIPDTPPRRPFR